VTARLTHPASAAQNRDVAPATRTGRLGHVLAVILVLSPALAAAQVAPTAPPHPTMPWTGIGTPYGQLIRFIYVPPQPVMLEYLVVDPPPPAPAELEAAPPSVDAPRREPSEGREEPERRDEPLPAAARVVHQQVTIPVYYVRETTVGFHYPERWIVEQAGPNAYRWRMLPAQFVPR
jgi:hypothetical protein